MVSATVRLPEPGVRTVLLAGSAGLVGGLLVEPLAAAYALRLADLRAPSGAAASGFVAGDLTDPAVADRAVAGVDAVVLTAGDPRPDAPWHDLARRNVELTAVVLEAAERHGVTRLVLASSVHVTGAERSWPVDPAGPDRPCCRYGASKAMVEQLARYHADRRPGLSVIALRFGLVAAAPRWQPETAGWTPTADVAPLVAGALAAPVHGFAAVFAVTAAEPARYRTEPTVALLGHRSRAVDHLSGPVGTTRPAYSPDCRLWSQPAPQHNQEAAGVDR